MELDNEKFHNDLNKVYGEINMNYDNKIGKVQIQKSHSNSKSKYQIMSKNYSFFYIQCFNTIWKKPTN